MHISACTNIKKILLVLVGSLCAFVLPALASHHFESKLSQKYPAFDITDAFVFPSERPGHTVFIMDVNPGAEFGANPFGEQGLYNFHVAFVASLQSGLTYTVRFEGDVFYLGKIAAPNTEIGEEGAEIGSSKIGEALVFPDGIKVWSGVVRDPFMGNAAGLAAFKSALDSGTFDEKAFDNGDDFFATQKVGSIVIEVPNQILAPEVRYFTTSARKIDGKWKQINRVANVLVTHLFYGNNIGTIHEHIHHRPDTDKERRYAIANTVLRAVSAGKTAEDPVAYADKVAKNMLPDVLTYKTGTAASYGVDRRNGRRLNDDGMDTALSIYSGRPMTDYANTTDRYQKGFPYVVPATE